jgi:GAF domain-containing protein
MISILSYICGLARSAPSLEVLQKGSVEAIANRLPYYNWSGFYTLDSADPKTLILGPYVGDPTPHVRIPVAESICGAAASSGQTVFVDDVNADPRYLSCSIRPNPRSLFPSTRMAASSARSISTATHQPLLERSTARSLKK